jgi:murein DD-endopeptidase MepM/ murein hydrolase activator NlpD
MRSLFLLKIKFTARLNFHRVQRAFFRFCRYLTGIDLSPVFHTAKIVLLILSIASFLTLIPAPFSHDNDELPYFGDFSWQTDRPVRLSPGDFRENARGGIEDYIPKLRLVEYTIERGDTLWSISRKFDVDPDSIISCNVFTNVHSIHEGDVILIPNIRGIFVNVQQGDTIFQYSTKYRIPPDFIMEVNYLRSNELDPGMKIFLPGVKFSNMERAYALGEAFNKPVRGRLTSRFGYRRDPFTRKRAFHRGIDLANRVGSRVYAAQEGKVIYTGKREGYGITVIIEHRFGYKSLYGHLASYSVKRGQSVKSGQIIGTIGDSGRATGPHVHFEIWHKNRIIDPLTQTNMVVR